MKKFLEVRNVIPFLMGTGSVLVQIVLLRELVTVFSGNELDMGITLSVWLTAVGIGSLTGTRFSGSKMLALSFLAIAVLLQPVLFMVHVVRPVLSMEYGEVISLGATIISTLVIMFPLCFILGIQFPLAVSWRGGSAAIVYALEGAGAFFGGVLFTFLLAGRISGETLLTVLSLLNIFAVVLVSKRLKVFFLVIVAIIFHFGFQWGITAYALKGSGLVREVESRYGELTVHKMGEQRNVYFAGKLAYSYPDHEEEEFIAHTSMLLHESAKDVLLVGGSPAVIGELLKYDPDMITFIETDPKMITLSLEIMKDADREYTRDRRVKVLARDARMFIKNGNGRKYDLIILNIPEPLTANVNRFYTVEFFRETARIMKEDGVIVLRLLPSHGYVGKRVRMLNGSIFYSLSKVFPFTGLSSEEYGLIFGSKTPFAYDTELLKERFMRRNIRTDNFRPFVIDDSFDAFKREMYEKRISGVSVLNSDMRPVAYLYNLMMWSKIHGGGWLLNILEYNRLSVAVLSVFFLVLAIGSRMKRKTAYFTFFSTGYVSMAFVMLMILSYQAVFGYVYERIGLITASFMLGVATGGLSVKYMRNAITWLRTGDIIMLIILLLSPFLMHAEFLYYVLACGAGMITGIQFAASSMLLVSDPSPQIAGRLYFFDLAGSFFGAFFTTILFVPIIGIQNTVLFMVFIKAISFIVLLTIRHGKS